MGDVKITASTISDVIGEEGICENARAQEQEFELGALAANMSWQEYRWDWTDIFPPPAQEEKITMNYSRHLVEIAMINIELYIFEGSFHMTEG